MIFCPLNAWVSLYIYIYIFYLPFTSVILKPSPRVIWQSQAPQHLEEFRIHKDTLQETITYPFPKHFWVHDFILFQRWDMLVPWMVQQISDTLANICCIQKALARKFPALRNSKWQVGIQDSIWIAMSMILAATHQKRVGMACCFGNLQRCWLSEENTSTDHFFTYPGKTVDGLPQKDSHPRQPSFKAAALRSTYPPLKMVCQFRVWDLKTEDLKPRHLMVDW